MWSSGKPGHCRSEKSITFLPVFRSNNHSNHRSRQAWKNRCESKGFRLVFVRKEHRQNFASFGPGRGQGTTQTIRSQGAGVPVRFARQRQLWALSEAALAPRCHKKHREPPFLAVLNRDRKSTRL